MKLYIFLKRCSNSDLSYLCECPQSQARCRALALLGGGSVGCEIAGFSSRRQKLGSAALSLSCACRWCLAQGASLTVSDPEHGPAREQEAGGGSWSFFLAKLNGTDHTVQSATAGKGPPSGHGPRLWPCAQTQVRWVLPVQMDSAAEREFLNACGRTGGTTAAGSPCLVRRGAARPQDTPLPRRTPHPRKGWAG